MSVQAIQDTINHTFGLYEKFGERDYIGEPVSQMEHMLQAAQLAIDGGYDDEVILAAFFHDIGHLCVMVNESNDMGGFGVKNHEMIGAEYLREQGYPEKMARLVESHVEAKRYLTYKSQAYYDSLSEASKRTLEFQGGRMTAEEAEVLEKEDLFEMIIQMRKWDELAKSTAPSALSIDTLKEKAHHVLSSQKAK